MMARTNFKECMGAELMQALDLADELDRPRQLPGEKVANSAGIIGVRFGSTVGEDGQRAGGKLNILQSGPKWRDGRGHERTVKSSGHGQALGANISRSEGLRGAFNVRCSP